MNESMVWTYDKDNFARLPQIVNALHERNMHFVPIILPTINIFPNYPPYNRGIQLDVFIKFNGSNFVEGVIRFAQFIVQFGISTILLSH